MPSGAYSENCYEDAVIEALHKSRWDWFYGPDIVRDYRDPTYTAGLVVNGTNHFVEVGAGTREVVFQRVHPDDWDMDGLPNSIDDNPQVPSPNIGYNLTDAWAMAAFPSNSAEIVTMGYAAWVAARAAETNRHLVGMTVVSPNGAWPLCLSVDDKQVMCNGKAELKFALDDGAKYRFSVAGGEAAMFSVLGANGVETVDTPGSAFLPFETSVGGVTVHWDSPSGGWLGCLADVGITLDGRNVVDFGYLTDQAEALLDHYQTNDCIELYFLGNIDNGSTQGFRHSKGVVVAKSSDVYTLAHEIGHRLGLNDCYPYVGHKVAGTNTWTFLPGCSAPVNHALLTGRRDWGLESGRGFYEQGDTPMSVYKNYLMYGYTAPLTKDIPDGRVFSLWDGARSTNDVWYAEIGAEGINTNNLEVYTK